MIYGERIRFRSVEREDIPTFVEWFNDPDVIEIYGTDEEIYRTVNEVFSRINIKFERAEEEIMAQMARNRSLVPGSREYDITLDQLVRKKLGDPQN